MPDFLSKLDEALFHFINCSLANPLGDFLFPLFNSGFYFIPFLFVGIIWLSIRKSQSLWIIFGVTVLAIAINDSLVFNPLKQMIGRTRPAVHWTDIRVLASGATGGFAFPSSHTANCFLAATILGVGFKRYRILFFSLAALVGFARIYVGVHHPSDVIGSAILGSAMGWISLIVLCQVWKLGFSETTWPFSNSKISENQIRNENLLGPKALGFAVTPMILLALVQIARLYWTCQTELSVPPLSAALCAASYQLHSSAALFYSFGKVWFSLFGSSALSLWAIPWFFQTLWIGILSWIALKRGGAPLLWSLSFLIIVLSPLVSQLSFLGSPAQIFEDSDFQISRVSSAFIFYTILGLPLWIAAIFFIKARPLSSLMTLGGWVIGFSFPQIPWHIIAFTTSGTLLTLAEALEQKWKTKKSSLFQLSLTILCVFGVTISIAIYNPRFLRKLNYSILPRNSPQYLQIGWNQWIDKIHTLLDQSSTKQIWTDSPTSRDVIQYLLGSSFQVLTIEEGLKRPLPQNGVYYIREVYFAQIHPTLLFVNRRDWKPVHAQFNCEEVDSLDIFSQGDPIRKFHLFSIKPKTPSI
jgi:undecaprenyl-diphosphatase